MKVCLYLIISAILSIQSAFADQHPSFKQVIKCGSEDEGFIRISVNPDNPKMQRIHFNEKASFKIGQHLNILSPIGISPGYGMSFIGSGDVTSSGDDFKGFAATVMRYVSNSGDAKTLHVFKDHIGIKIKSDIQPHYLCEYWCSNGGYPIGMSLPQEYGKKCPRIDVWGDLIGSKPGTVEFYSREYYIDSCEFF